MRVWGLTGGIASGKSTVSSMFRELGFPVVDADTVAREVVGPGQPALAQVAARFPGVVTADGALDRAQLAARIFADPSERIALNAITHPAIAAAVRARLQALAEAGESHAIYDAALLIENRLHETLDGVILVTAPVELQRARLAARNHLPPEVAEARIASQLPLSAKRPHARWVVDNGGTIEATRAQVEHVAAQLRALAGA